MESRGPAGRRAAPRQGMPPERDAAWAVETVIDLVRGTRISDFEVEWEGGSVRVSREPSVAADPVLDAVSSPDDDQLVVTSRYVGVFHREPASAFPDVGEAVSAGQILGNVETLRIQNTVTAPEDGTLIDVLIGDGTPVEYGQPLLVIRRGATFDEPGAAHDPSEE